MTVIANASPVPVSLQGGVSLAPGESADMVLTQNEQDLVAIGALVVREETKKPRPAAAAGKSTPQSAESERSND